MLLPTNVRGHQIYCKLVELGVLVVTLNYYVNVVVVVVVLFFSL